MEKHINTKNYIILGALIIITVFATFYARSWYNATKEYNAEPSIMLTLVGEINPNEIGNYMLESSNFILYAAPSENNQIKSFERTFKSYILKQNLEDSILYINTDNYTNDELENQLKAYSDKTLENQIKINNNATIFIVKDQKITYVIKNVNKLSIKDIHSYLKSYGVITND